MRKLLLTITILLFVVLTLGIAGCTFNVMLPRASYKPGGSASAAPDTNYVRFTSSDVELGVGETVALSGYVETNIPNANMNWALTDGNGIVTLNSSNGDITGVAQGTAYISVSLIYQGKSYSASIKATVKGNYLELHDANNNKVTEITLYVGDVVDLSTYIYTNVPLDKVNVNLGTGSNAYVSLSGKTVTATAPSGNNYATVTLVAPDYDNLEFTFKIFVKAIPNFEFYKDGVSIDNIDIYVGGTLNLNDYVSTSEPSVSYAMTAGQDKATISGTNITGVSAGTGTVQATLSLTDSFVPHDPLTDTATVTVLNRPTNAFALNVHDVTIVVNGTKNMWSEVTQNLHDPVTAADCTWTVNNANTQVSNVGVVTGKAVGTSTLTVSVTQLGYTFSDTATITVNGTQFEFPESMSGHPELQGGVLTITVGDVVNLNTYLTTNLDNPTITWTLTDGSSYITLVTSGSTAGQVTGTAVTPSGTTAHVKASTTIDSLPLEATISIKVEAPAVNLTDKTGNPIDPSAVLAKIYADESIDISTLINVNTNIVNDVTFTFACETTYAQFDTTNNTLLMAKTAAVEATAQTLEEVEVGITVSCSRAGSTPASTNVKVAKRPVLKFTSTSMNVFVGDSISLNTLLSSVGTLHASYPITYASSSTAVTISGSTATVQTTGNATITATMTSTYSTLGSRQFVTDTANKITFTAITAPTFEFTESSIAIPVYDSTDATLFNLGTLLTTGTGVDRTQIVWSITDGGGNITWHNTPADGIIEGTVADTTNKVEASYDLGGGHTVKASITVRVLSPLDPKLVIIYTSDLVEDKITDNMVGFNSNGSSIVSVVQEESLQSYSETPIPAYTLTSSDYSVYKMGTSSPYTYSLTLKKAYLETLAAHSGQYELTVTLSGSYTQLINIIVVDGTITTVGQLQAIGSSEENLRKSYVLGCDIDCSGVNFEPLGVYYNDNCWPKFNDGKGGLYGGKYYLNTPFMGTINGNGHTIYNLYIDATAGSANNWQYGVHRDNWSVASNQLTGGRNIGFISYLGSSGMLKNVTFQNVCVISGKQNSGIVFGTTVGTAENVMVNSLTTYNISSSTYTTVAAGTNISSGYSAINTGATLDWGWEGGDKFGLDCFSGTFAGTVGLTGRMINCVSLATVASYNNKSIRGFVGKTYGTDNNANYAIENCFSYALTTLANPNSSGQMRDFSTVHSDLNPKYDSDDANTFSSCYNATPPSDVLVDLNNIGVFKNPMGKKSDKYMELIYDFIGK